MLGRVGSSTPVIPTPEAGVCTVYPIAIPVTTDLIHYSSPFNSCLRNVTGVLPFEPFSLFPCGRFSSEHFGFSKSIIFIIFQLAFGSDGFVV